MSRKTARRRREQRQQQPLAAVPVQTPSLPEDLNQATPAQPPTKGMRTQPQGDFLREYVSGGKFLLSEGARSLEFSIDDVTATVSQDIYERMMTDAEVHSDYVLLRDSVLGSGIQFAPAVSEEDPDYTLAQEITVSLTRSLSNLKRPFRETLEMMFEAIAYGSKVAEKTYRLDEVGADKGRYVFDSIRVKPRRSVAFVVNAFMEVLGFLYVDPRHGMGLAFASSIVDGARVLPRAKFALLTNDPRDEDPRGQSEFRSAYNPWNIKSQLWIEYLRYLLQFAMASLIGTTAEGAAPEDLRNEAGQLVKDSDGNTLQITAEEAMLMNLLRLRNGTAAVFAFGAKVDMLKVDDNGKNFVEAFSLFNQQISKAITGQSLATQEGEHQARAAADTHQDVLDKRVARLKTTIADMVRGDIARQFVEINWGPEVAERLTPAVSLGEVEQADWSKEVTAASHAVAAPGWLSPSQKQWIAVNRLRMPPMRPGEAVEEPKPADNNPPPDDENIEDDTERETRRPSNYRRFVFRKNRNYVSMGD